MGCVTLGRHAVNVVCIYLAGARSAQGVEADVCVLGMQQAPPDSGWFLCVIVRDETFHCT